MSKLIEQNQPKKSRFLKYSLLASISVGAIIAMPFEGMASSDMNLDVIEREEKILKSTSSVKPLNRRPSLKKGNRGQIANSDSSEAKNANSADINEGISRFFQSEFSKISNPEKVLDHSNSSQTQNNYSLDPTKQTPKKPEIVIKEASPASSGSYSFVTASPNTPNTTPPFLTPLGSPEHVYKTPPSTTVSSPSTPYQPTPQSKLNDGVGANTSQKSKAARKILFSKPQHTVQLGKPKVPPRPITSVQLPIKRSSTEVAAKMVSNILRVNETIGIKLAEVTLAIKDTKGKKNKAPLQKLQKQLISSQKTTKALKLEAVAIGIKIKTLSDKNKTLEGFNKSGGGVKSLSECNADKQKIEKNIKEIEKFEKELNKVDRLSKEIDVSVGGIVLTKPQEKAPVTERSTAVPFLNQQQRLDELTQQQAARQSVIDKNKEIANGVKRKNADAEKLTTEMNQVQLEQNQRHIAAEKIKKQQQAENKQRSEREKKRKEENHQKEKARDIVGIRENIVAKMQQIPGTNTISNKLQELELKVNNIEDKKKKQEAQKQLSEIKKQEKTIKTATDKAQEIADSAKTETSRTEIQKLQTKMNGYYETVTNGKIAVDIQNLERLVLTPSAPPSTATIYNKAKPIMPLTLVVRGILGKQPEEEDGYLVPIQGKPETYITLLPTDPKSMDSGFGSLPNGTLGKETDEDAGFYQNWSNVLHTQEQPIPQNLNSQASFQSSYPKDIYEAKVSQYINILRNTQPNKSNQDQINVAIDSLVAEMKKLNQVQFSQKLDEIIHLANKSGYENLLLRLYEVQQARVQETKEVHKQAEVFQSYDGNQQLKTASIQNTSNILMQGVANLEVLRQKLNAENQNLLKILNIMPQTHHTKIPDESLGSDKISTQKPKQSDILSELLHANTEDPTITDLRNKIFKGNAEIQQLEEDINILKNETIQSNSLSRTSSASSLNDLSSSNVTNLEKLKYAHEGIANDYKAKLDALDPEDSKFKELMLEVFKMSKDKIWLEEEIKQHLTENKPVFSPSVDSINSVSSDDDLSSRGVVTPVGTPTIETNKDYVDAYIKVLSNKIQRIEELPGSSSRSEKLNQIKEAMTCISNHIQDIEELDEKMLLAINARLQEHDEKISSLLPEEYIRGEVEEMSASDDESKSALPAGDEEQEGDEVTDTSKELSSLPAPASSNECVLALSDCREWLALGDGSEDEEDDNDNDSGVEEDLEEEVMEQLSDSEDDNFEATKIDAAILLKKEEATKSIAAIAPTLNQGSKIVKSIGNLITSTRLDTAVAAGDEEEVRIKRGLWVRGMYGINNHGRVENINGYIGTNKGATIGFDVEIDNNIVGIAYSNVHSVFKFKNSKNNDKEIIDSHVVSIYGQKELPKDFALQALVSASKNFIKDKTTYSYGDNKIRSNVKHRNHSYNAEALLNYNYLVKNNLVITPNIGLRYGKSRDGVYNETGINVQEIALTMKENNILSGIVGTKVKVPLKDALKFNNLGLTFQGAVEHNFKEKTQRINRVVKIFDTEFKQNYAIPKQPKTSYNLGTGIMGSIKNTTISLDYNYYLNKHYRSHQGSVKLKVNL